MFWNGIKTTLGTTILGALAFATAACAGSGASDSIASAPVPVAYPRIPVQAYDSLVAVDAPIPVAVRINPEAVYTVEETDPPGLTVSYPKAGARLYFTFIRPGSLSDKEKIIDLRKQRISLNLNGTPARTLHSGPDTDGTAIIVTATSGTQIPVQLLGETDGYIITATAFIDDPRAATAYDSVAPLFRVLEHDLSKAVDNLHFSLPQQ